MNIAEIIIPATRMFLTGRGELTVELLRGRCDIATKQILCSSLERVCNCLVASSSSDIVVHEIGCPCVSQHEQALIMAIRALQSRNEFGYTAAMSAIVPPAAARVMRSDMQQIAQELSPGRTGSYQKQPLSTEALCATNPGAALVH